MGIQHTPTIRANSIEIAALQTDLVRQTIFQSDIEYHQKKVEHAYDVMEAYLNDGAFMAGSVVSKLECWFERSALKCSFLAVIVTA